MSKIINVRPGWQLAKCNQLTPMPFKGLTTQRSYRFVSILCACMNVQGVTKNTYWLFFAPYFFTGGPPQIRIEVPGHVVHIEDTQSLSIITQCHLTTRGLNVNQTDRQVWARLLPSPMLTRSSRSSAFRYTCRQSPEPARTSCSWIQSQSSRHDEDDDDDDDDDVVAESSCRWYGHAAVDDIFVARTCRVSHVRHAHKSHHRAAFRFLDEIYSRVNCPLHNSNESIGSTSVLLNILLESIGRFLPPANAGW